MKKIILAALLFITLFAKGQVSGPTAGNFLQITSTGYNWRWGYFQYLGLPTYAGAPAGTSAFTAKSYWGDGAVYRDSVAHKTYVFNGTTKVWDEIGGAAVTPAGGFGAIQINRFGAFKAPGTGGNGDSLYWLGGIVTNGYNKFGPGVTSAARLQIGSNNQLTPLIEAGPAGTDFNAVVDAATASDGWTAGSKFYWSDTLVTNNTTTHKRFGVYMKKATHFPLGPAVSQTFKFGHGADWTLYVKDTIRLNPQVTDGIAVFRSRLAIVKESGYTGRSVIRVGAGIADYSSAVLGLVELKGSSSGNRFNIVGAPGADNVPSTMGGLAGFSSYPLADGGNLDTIRNWVGFHAGAPGSSVLPHMDINIDFLGGVVDQLSSGNVRRSYGLYILKPTSNINYNFIGGKVSIDPVNGTDTLGSNTGSAQSLNVTGAVKMQDGNQGVGKIIQDDGTGNGIMKWVTPAGGGSIGGSTGGVDRQVLVANGTGGATLQAVPVTINSSGEITTPFAQIKDNGTASLFYNNTSVTGNTSGMWFQTDNGSGASGGTIQFLTGSQGFDVNANAGAKTTIRNIYGGNSGYWDLGSNMDIYGSSGTKTTLGANGTAAYFTINTVGCASMGSTSADASALMDLVSTTRGFGPPAMTTTQKNAISSPREGLIVYDLTLHKLCVYTGSAWETVTSL